MPQEARNEWVPPCPAHWLGSTLPDSHDEGGGAAMWEQPVGPEREPLWSPEDSDPGPHLEICEAFCVYFPFRLLTTAQVTGLGTRLNQVRIVLPGDAVGQD